jgi:hypothetical protein
MSALSSGLIIEMVLLAARLVLTVVAVFIACGAFLILRSMWRMDREDRMVKKLIEEGRADELTTEQRRNGFR